MWPMSSEPDHLLIPASTHPDGANRHKAEALWAVDTAASVAMFNGDFLRQAAQDRGTQQAGALAAIAHTLAATDHLTRLDADVLAQNPGILTTLRHCTYPPVAVDRLIGLAGVPASLVKRMESRGDIAARRPSAACREHLGRVASLLQDLLDPNLASWLARGDAPSETEVARLTAVVADRLCLTSFNSANRNEPEKRQLSKVQQWLEARGYTQIPEGEDFDLHAMRPGTFRFRGNVPVFIEHNGTGKVKMPVDVIIQPLNAADGDLPLLFEAKASGDHINPNKRRKEEAIKARQLRGTYGEGIRFNLILSGCFDAAYLRYEAAECIDWIWEHRVDDLACFGL